MITLSYKIMSLAKPNLLSAVDDAGRATQPLRTAVEQFARIMVATPAVVSVPFIAR